MNGYPTTQPCVICGKVKDNKVEPRFGYIVCSDHEDVRPVDIP